MNRRAVLAALGGAAVVSLTGCLSTPGDDPTDEPTAEPTTDDPTTTPPGSSDPEWNPGPESPFDSITVGTRENVAFPENHRPIDVRVWNAARESRTFSLALETPETTRMATDVTFPADGWLAMTVNEPGQYALSVAIDGESAGQVSIGPFDCNQTQVSVIADAAGRLTEQIRSTEIACPGPAIAGESFTSESGSCGGTESSAVAFAAEAVEVTGRISTPNPCYEVGLAAVEVRGGQAYGGSEDSVLVVTIETTGPGDEACVECVGSVPYSATIDFENDSPAAVRVVHERMDERRTVETVER